MAVSKKTKNIIKDIKGDKPIVTIKGKDLTKQSKAPLKNAYLFSYPAPKTNKKQLPYFDAQPIVIILDRKGDKILGINLNHLPFTLALQLAAKIERKAKNKKRALKYEEVKQAIKNAKIPDVYMMIAIKRYIVSRISGDVFPVGIADGEYRKALKEVPRKFKRKGLSASIRANQAKVTAYIRSQKKKK